MNRLDRIQRISGVFRYLLLLAAAVLAGIGVLALLVPDQALIIFWDGQINALRSSGAINLAQMLAFAAPFGILLGLGIFWLQRLFSEYHRGNFFTDGSMRCYVWLVWLKVAAFIYGIVLPLLLNNVASLPGSADITVNIELGTLVELVVLLVIVHLLKAAQQINEENKAFV